MVKTVLLANKEQVMKELEECTPWSGETTDGTQCGQVEIN